MQDFLRHNVYLCGENVAHDREGRQILRGLFGVLVAEPSLLPKRYRRRIGSAVGDSAHRVVCDYVAGMTDRYCRQQYERLCGGG